MKTLLNSIKIIVIAAVLAVGVSYVSAFTSPNGTVPTVNPDNNVPTPINIGSLVQTKIGSLTTESFLKSGSNITPGTTGWIIAANAAGATDDGGIDSIWQFFQKEYLSGKKAQMKVGSATPARGVSPLPSIDKTKFNPNDTAIPLTIDLMDRGTANNSAAGTQVMNLLASNSCNTTSTIQTNTAGIQFWSTKNINPNTNTAGDNADVIARGIQIGDSSAGAMKVLVATDTNGNAEWGTMSIVNGQVVVDYPSKTTGNNTVKYGQLCDTPPVTLDVCTNINGVQSTVPDGYTKDTAGNTPGICDPTPLCGTNAQLTFSTQFQFNNRDKTKDCAVGNSSGNLYVNGNGNWECDSGNQSISCSTGVANTLPGCFTSGTMIALANGSQKPIQEIQPGDQLKAVSGINTVKSLIRPKLGNQPVYSINGSEEFFTGNHPFLTTEGWKSIDPETTRREIPELSVTKMRIGDTLITEHGAMIVRTMIPTSATPDTQLYNFELDGDHTYYANGYAVHNKEAWPMCIYQTGDNPPASCNPISCTKNTDCSDMVRGYCSATTLTCKDAGESGTCSSNSDCNFGQCYNIITAAGASYGKYCLTPTNP